ncbi:threonine/serine dehydratase [Photorhabdus cinerea]|uniref:Serine dehydratase n=1 Tax=Photorhabdus cinerea TaxID=471575 RepID=A0A7X5QE01_9GAMM|nr:threonine/serine dehydratase [Photorhabdus cinerea]NHB92663.1 serine dehydratase [Photorhabdus cinerea]
MQNIPVYDDVVAAARRIENYVYRTPVLTSRTADEMTGARLFFKCENYQRMGAFKFRGAFNALSARILNIPATIIMPHDAPAAKVDATKGYGGKVIFYDRYVNDREQIGRELSENQGLTLIPPYDHPHIIAGQGTAAKELFEEVGELDALFVCLGGGGLLSGSALAARYLSPGCKIYGVEPEAGNDAQQSFRQGKIIHIDTPKTIADGAQTQHIGQYTYEIIRKNIDDIFTVSDEELVETMRFYAERMKMIVEPTGCLSFAAVRQISQQLQGQNIGIIVSGGNVDIAHYCALLAR